MEKHVFQEQLTLSNVGDPGGLVALQSHNHNYAAWYHQGLNHFQYEMM